MPVERSLAIVGQSEATVGPTPRLLPLSSQRWVQQIKPGGSSRLRGEPMAVRCIRCVAGMERCGICVSRQQGKVPISG